MQMRLAEIAEAIGAGDFSDSYDVDISGICTDSRQVEPGDLFVALKGDRVDGHDFVFEATQAGASALLLERSVDFLYTQVPVMRVNNSIQALGKLAAEYRKRFSGRVIGITGTAGKTTVKEMIALLLEYEFDLQVGKSYKNWNNLLGLSLSILSMSGQEDFWVLELGVSEVGEMACLGDVACPDLGVIINVGPAHLQGLESEEGVAKEKVVILDFLSMNGVAAVSLDYPVLNKYLGKRGDLNWKRFSCWQCKSECFGKELGRSCSGSKFSYNVWSCNRLISFTLPWPGMLENILASVASLEALDIELSATHYSLESLSIPEHRFHIQEFERFTIIDDCYNSNPLSMQSALAKLAHISEKGPYIIILGEMMELGTSAEELHYQLGTYLARFRDIYVFYQGNYSKEVGLGFSANQVDQYFFPIRDLNHFMAQWRRLHFESGLILIKGSRGCALENYVQALIQEIHQ